MTSIRVAAQARPIQVLSAGSILLILIAGLAVGLGRPAKSGNDRLLASLTDAPVPPLAEDSSAVPEMLAIVGRVLDAKGEPIPGARLYSGVSPPGEDRPSSVRATTGPDGRFHFPLARSELAASRSAGAGEQGPLVAAFADGYGPAWSADLKIGEPDGLLFTLPPDDVPVTGRLIDLEGQPVAGVSVRVLQLAATPEEDLSSWLKDVAAGLPGYRAFSHLYLSRPMEAGLTSLIRPASTGLDGQFRLTGLGRERLGTLLIQGPKTATRILNVITRPGASVSVRVSDPTPGEPSNRTHSIHSSNFVEVIAPSRPVEGIVRDRDTNRPLPGVRVRNVVGFGNTDSDILDSLTDWPGTFTRTTTNEQGQYRLEGLPIRETVTLRADPADGQPYHPGSREFANRPGAGSTSIDFALTPGVLVRGRATDRATGAPVAALIEYQPTVENEKAVRSRELAPAEARPTDRDGRYALVTFPGPGLITAKALGDRFLHADLVATGESEDRPTFPNVNEATSPSRCHAFATIDPAALTDAGTCDLALTAGPEPLVTILGPDGQPLAGSQASGLSSGDLARQGWWQSRVKARFPVTGLTDRRIRVVLFQHMNQHLAGSLAVRDSEAGPLVVQLRPWGAVSGRLVDSHGRPRPDILLSYRGSPNVHRSASLPPHDARTDRDGRFSLTGLVPGQEYVLRIADEKGTGPKVGDSVNLEPGETTVLGDVREVSP